MTKKNFAFLVMAVVGGLMFAIGMCMCLLPEWNAFVPGVVLTAIGAVALLALAVVRWVMAGKPVASINWNMVGKVIYCVGAALVLGTGMALIMAFDGMMVAGIIIGVVGIAMALGIIPLFKGFK